MRCFCVLGKGPIDIVLSGIQMLCNSSRSGKMLRRLGTVKLLGIVFVIYILFYSEEAPVLSLRRKSLD
jgi:hypothetical protein